MDNHKDSGDRRPRPVSLLNDLAAVGTVAATAEMPAELAAMLNPEKGVFIRANKNQFLTSPSSRCPARADSGAWSTGLRASPC